MGFSISFFENQPLHDFPDRAIRRLLDAARRVTAFVLYHRVADPESARVRAQIVERGLKPRIDFQNVDTDAAAEFAVRGGRRVPALWDGAHLHEGAAAVLLAIGAIMPTKERPP